MRTINYVTGDATLPEGEGPKIIAHICNDANRWGAGFVMALSARDRVPQLAYHAWFAGLENNMLGRLAGEYVPNEPPVGGMVQMVPYLIDGIWVCNMIAQCNTCSTMRIAVAKDPLPPIRYLWLATCLTKLRRIANAQGASVHMPRIGTGLAGGKWERIEPLINALLCRYDVPVTVYDLPLTPMQQQAKEFRGSA